MTIGVLAAINKLKMKALLANLQEAQIVSMLYYSKTTPYFL
jgi:hypothetical protein